MEKIQIKIDKKVLNEVDNFLNRLYYYNENIFDSLLIESKFFILDVLSKKIDEFNNLIND